MHGLLYANWAVMEEDLLRAWGVRLDDRVTGKVEKFAEHGTIVHIDIDFSELNKNKVVKLPIHGDIKYALKELNRLLAETGHQRESVNFTLHGSWYKKIATWKQRYPLDFKDTEDVIQPQYVIKLLDEMTKGEAIITTGVGQHQMWAGQYYSFSRTRQFLTSAGLGAMGFGFPAAIGAKVAFPDRQVIDIDGDGSFLMNIQELACGPNEDITAQGHML